MPVQSAVGNTETRPESGVGNHKNWELQISPDLFGLTHLHICLPRLRVRVVRQSNDGDDDGGGDDAAPLEQSPHPLALTDLPAALLQHWYSQVSAAAEVAADVADEVAHSFLIGLGILCRWWFQIVGPDCARLAAWLPLPSPVARTRTPSPPPLLEAPGGESGAASLKASLEGRTQIGLHTWLPDAMEGPTPVSALIHAATVVTAGVFMTARCSPLFKDREGKGRDEVHKYYNCCFPTLHMNNSCDNCV